MIGAIADSRNKELAQCLRRLTTHSTLLSERIALKKQPQSYKFYQTVERRCPSDLCNVVVRKSKTDGILARSSGGSRPAAALQAQPSMTLAETKQLQQSQRFDVTAIIASISDSPRPGTETRRVVDVLLLDASGPSRRSRTIEFCAKQATSPCPALLSRGNEQTRDTNSRVPTISSQ